MKKKLLIVLALGSVAAITIVVLAVLFIQSIPSLRESKLIETIKRPAPPGERGVREAAVRELGRMGSVRAIPYIIQLWDEPLFKKEKSTVLGRRETVPVIDEWAMKECSAGCEALVAIGAPAIPFLGRVLDDRNSNKRVMAIIICKKMGPEALPLLPELLELYRRRDDRWEEAVEAIRAIGEPESVKEVAKPPSFKNRPLRLRSQSGFTDGPDKR